jgi:site-specific DNA-methyltransferase (adenine-specific)
MKRIPDGSIDMILCDLPYGTTNCQWDSVIPFEPLWAEYKRISKQGAAIVLTSAQPFTSALVLSNPKWFRYDLIWDKVKGTGFLNAKHRPMRNHEVICVFSNAKSTYNPQMSFGHNRKVSRRGKQHQTDVYGEMNKDYTYDSTERYPRSIITISTDTQNSSLHPTQKPVELFEYLVRTYTNPGETVLDNCMGSGTTAIACIKTGRNFIGFELDAEYCRVANERIKTVQMVMG